MESLLRLQSNRVVSSVLVSTLIFLISCMVGYIAHPQIQPNLEEALNQALPAAKTLWVGEGSSTLLFVLRSNLKVFFLLSVVGVLTFGFQSLVVLSWNGFDFGMFLGKLLALNSGVVRTYIFALTLPHAIIEFLGMVIGGAMGVRTFWVLWDYMNSKEFRLSKLELKRLLRDLTFYGITALALIVAAASIEALVTPVLAQWVQSRQP